MVLVEPPSPVAKPEPPAQPPTRGPDIAQRPANALSASFDQINDIFDPVDDEIESSDLTEATETPEVIEEAVETATVPSNDTDSAETIPEVAFDPSGNWTDARMRRWRPRLLGVGAGLLALVATLGIWQVVSKPKPEPVIALKPVQESGQLESEVETKDAEFSSAPTPKEPAAAEDVEPAGNEVEQEPAISAPEASPPTIVAEAEPTADTQDAADVEPTETPRKELPTNSGADFFAEVDKEFAREVKVASIAEKANAESRVKVAPVEETVVEVIERVPDGNLTEIDVASRLRDQVKEFRLNDVPLKSALRLVSEMSTIPISIRYEGLQHSGISLAEPISVETSSSDIGGLLTKMLSPNRLGYQVTDGVLIVGRASSDDGIRTDNYRVRDLLHSKTQHELFGRMLQHVVQPGSWVKNNKLTWKDNALVVTHEEIGHYEVLMFCERLRRARGLKKASRYPDELFRLESPGQFVGKQLQERIVSVSARRPTLLVDILNRIAREIDCEILIDWHALRGRGWGADADAILDVRDVPFATAMEQLLRPMRLTYRALDSGTLEVTTEATELKRDEIAMYPVRDLFRQGYKSKEIISRIRSEIGPEYFKKGGGTGAAMIDPVSQHLVVRLPQSRQLIVAQILGDLRQL